MMKTAEVILSDLIHSSLQLDEQEFINMANELSQIKNKHISFICESDYHFITADFIRCLNQKGFHCDFFQDSVTDDILFIIETPTLQINQFTCQNIFSISTYSHSFVDELSSQSIHLCKSQNDFDLSFLNKANYKQMIMLIFDSLLMLL